MSTTTPDIYEPSERAQSPLTDERVWRERIMIGLGLTALVSVLAIIVSVAALSSGGSTANGALPAIASGSGSGAPAGIATATGPVVAPQSLKVVIKTDVEHGRRGPDGKWHDAFLPADFSVHAGAQVTVTFVNYDSGPHTFTSPAMGVNDVIPGGGSPTTPRTVTFTFTAPKKAGHYEWWCSVPCDPWSMAHNGYMRGVVTVSA